MLSLRDINIAWINPCILLDSNITWKANAKKKKKKSLKILIVQRYSQIKIEHYEDQKLTEKGC